MPPPQFNKTAPAPTATATKPAVAPVTAPVATKPVTTAPVAQATAPAANDSASATGTEEKVRTSKFGPVDIAIPTICGQDLREVHDRLVGALNGIDVAAFVQEFESTSSQSFPGSKVGRAAFGTANVVCRIAAVAEMYVAKQVRKPGGNKRFLAVLKLLLKNDKNAKQTLLAEGIDLGNIDLDSLQAE